jgi:acyl-CoA hydrolase
MAQAERIATLDIAVARIVERAGPDIVAALPLGLGKPNRLLNALYRKVADDPRLSLTIYTALSLARPAPRPGLEGRFAAPFVERHFGRDYPDLAWIADLRANRVPANIRICEFYLQSASMLGNDHAQRNYASINYTHVAREVAARAPTLLLQQVARRGERISLSSNTDTTLDLFDALTAAGQPRPYCVAVVHPDLPFLGNDAELELDFFDAVVEEPGPAHTLFALPHEPVALAEFALGLHASALVRDGGTLQIGIGALSDALVHALLLRHRDNAGWRSALAGLRHGAEAAIAARIGGDAPFVRGLYGASEMVMDGFMHLRRAGILVREVYEDVALQRLLNAGAIGRTADGSTLDRLIEADVVAAVLDRPSVDWLQRFGLLDASALLHDGLLRFDDGASIGADLHDRGHREQLAARVSGRRLRGGRYLHGAFWLGTRDLLAWLGQLSGDDYDGLCMTRVSWINELYGGREALDVAQRHEARFFNTCMMQTLLGASVSDALADGQVVSGVGGQYNFVAMAHALAGGRSALMLRATRDSGGRTMSNILWNYGHATIPRHLRDLLITEYGVADLRGATDEEVVQRTLAVTDARFIDDLAARAIASGKLARGFVVPDAWRRNTPAAIADALRAHRLRGVFPTFPFGSDFDADELRLLPALRQLKAVTATRGGKLRALLGALAGGAPAAEHARLLARLGLDHPVSWAQRIEARLVARALHDSAGAG